MSTPIVTTANSSATAAYTASAKRTDLIIDAQINNPIKGVDIKKIPISFFVFIHHQLITGFLSGIAMLAHVNPCSRRYEPASLSAFSTRSMRLRMAWGLAARRKSTEHA